MDKHLQTLQHNLEAAVQRADAQGIEFWFARDLQAHLGYARWENFQTAIQRAMESCEATGHAASDHFRGVTKMIELGSSSKREIGLFGICGQRQFPSSGGVPRRGGVVDPSCGGVAGEA